MSYKDLQWIKYCSDPKVIFDIGAFNCDDSLGFMRCYPNAEIHSFEASRNNIIRCQQNINGSNIKLHNIALSDKKGETTFWDSHGIDVGSGSIMEYNNNRDGLFMHQGYVVPTTSIDIFCKENNITELSFIHLDVQGAEYKVLSGLGDCRPRLVFAETCEYAFYKDSLSRNDLDDLMISKGYHIAERLTYDTLYILK